MLPAQSEDRLWGADIRASLRLDQWHFLTACQPLRILRLRLLITCRIQRTSALACSPPASLIAGSNWKDRSSTAVSRMSIVITSMLTNGIPDPRGSGSCQTVIGPFQISHGFLRSPEGQEPDADIRRTTASLQYNRPFNRGNWASAFVWGRNHVSELGEIRNLNSYTVESTVQFLDKNFVYTRLELVDKDELLRAADRAVLGITEDHPSFRIGGYTFGGVRDLWTTDKVQFGIGSDLTFYSKPAILDAIYGSNPVSWKVFFRIRPGKMDMSMHGMHGTSGNMNEPPSMPKKH